MDSYLNSKPIFSAQCILIPYNIKEKMKKFSWKPNCPVKMIDLLYIRLSHWGFDGNVHQGELIVHTKVADDIVNIFSDLFDKKFAIEKMKIISKYKGDDNLSTEDNNTSAFNCRLIVGGNRFSEHSFGTAIDINPVINPYIKNGKVLPTKGVHYLDRTKKVNGMIIKNDICYRAFTERGWKWGGDWTSLKDYQHFEKKIF